MVDPHRPDFPTLLRQLRAAARLTQEELAEAATVSPRSISDLERGINRTARKATAQLLAEALRLSEPVHGLFIAVARGKAPAADAFAALQGLAAEITTGRQRTCSATQVQSRRCRSGRANTAQGGVRCGLS
jgi:transcriptional regulator with XRE-family HTH domain